MIKRFLNKHILNAEETKTEMALSNYTLSFASSLPPSPFVVNNQHLQRDQYSDLLYSPEAQQSSYNAESYKNDPFSQPEPQRQEKRAKLRKRAGQTYLPPPNQFTQYPKQENPMNNPYSQQNIYQPPRLPVDVDNQRLDNLHDPYQGGFFQEPNGRHFDGFPGFPGGPPIIPPQPHILSTATPSYFTKTMKHNSYEQPNPARIRPQSSSNNFASNTPIKQQPSGFTKVEAGGSDGKTRLHAVLDYDDDEYDDGSQNLAGLNIVNQQVTPLQGPILLKNGSVPVVPLFSYPTVNNGSLFQIPILWTALSLALGYEIQGQVIKGVPCVKRNYQLYCPTAGNTYPLDKIEHFIDENKALIKRMYGSFTSKERSTGGGIGRRKRAPGVPDPAPDESFEGEPDPHLGDSYFRHIRQAGAPPLNSGNNGTKRIDACESKTEIITPYWALNSARKLRAIVNTMHFEQAIHQEVCSKTTTTRCTNDCGCEQKYKWHRLLAYDPDEDCAGIFMDWFLFPSCCVCRCNP